MFFFFNYKHFPAVVVDTTSPSAGSAYTDSAEFSRPVTVWTKKRRKRTYVVRPSKTSPKAPVQLVEATKETQPVVEVVLAPKVRKALTYINNPIEYTPYKVPEIEFEALPKIVDIVYVPPKKEPKQKDYSKVEVVKPVPSKPSWVDVIAPLVKEQKRLNRLEELKAYGLQLQKQIEKRKYEEKLKEEREEYERQEEIALLLLAAGEEDLAASLLSLQ